MEVLIEIEFMSDDEFEDEFLGQGPMFLEEVGFGDLEPAPKREKPQRVCCAIT